MRYIASSVALLAFVGCASQPVQLDSAPIAQSPGSHTQAATLAPAPVAPVAQAPEAHTEGAVLASALSKDTHAEAVSLVSNAAGLPAEGADKEAVDLAKARKLGYRIVDKDGETVYCHDTKATGSHLQQQTICLTKQQWDTVSDTASRAMQRMQGVTSACPKGGSCGG
jgi:hypothetical protein